MTAALSLGLVAVPVILDWFHRSEIRRLKVKDAQVRNELEQARGDLRSLTGEISQIRLHLERADAVRNKRAWSGVFGILGRIMPEGCWLTSLATDPAVAPTMAGASCALESTPRTAGKNGEKRPVATIEAPRKLRLSGYAGDASLPHRFVKGLKETALFSQVTLQKAIRETTAEGLYYRFDVECEW